MASTVKAYPNKARLHIWDSVLSGIIVLYATYLLQNVSDNRILLCILFFLLTAESAIRPADGKCTRTQRFCLIAIYLAGAVLILVLTPFHSSLLAAATVVMIVLLFNRVAAILKKPKKRILLLNVFCILIVLVIGFFIFTSDMIITKTVEMDESELKADANFTEIADSLDKLESATETYVETNDLIVYMYLMIVILLQMIFHVVGISVSQMKLNILMNIIRETYVLEILLGLLLMIITCSTVFMTLEDSMSNYGDALWYSFALVTTIGFGDIAASTVIGRLLSVFLGIYGIVVVAIITSVIVNFYGEMRRMSGQKTDTAEQLPDTEK